MRMLNVFVGYNPRVASIELYSFEKPEYKMMIESIGTKLDDLTSEKIVHIQEDVEDADGNFVDHYVVIARSDIRGWELAQEIRHYQKYQTFDFAEYLKVGDFVKQNYLMGRVVAIEGNYAKIYSDRTKDRYIRDVEILHATLDGYAVQKHSEFEAPTGYTSRWKKIPEREYYTDEEWNGRPEIVNQEWGPQSQTEIPIQYPEQETINLVKTKRRNA